MFSTKFPTGTVLLILIVLFLTLSCQSGEKDPVTPSGDNINPVTTQNNPAPTGNNNVMWGYWHVAIDPASGDVSTIPMRGVQFCANVNMFLEPNGNPGPNLGIALDFANSDIDNNLLAVDVMLNHPLPFDEYSGFDVRGIFIHNSSVTAKSDSAISYGVTGNDDDAVLLNADGYTRWWNPNEFMTPGVLGYTQGALASFNNTPTATLNGYITFMDGLGVEESLHDFIIQEDNYNNRGWFAAGSSNTRKYLIQFPVGQALEYDYCVFASWNETDPKNTGDPDEYEPADWDINSNCPEAFLIGCDSSESTAYYNSPSDNGGILNLKIEVFDWQGAFGQGSIISDEINEIRIESLSGLINETSNTYIVSGPDIELISSKGSEISSVYDVDITNLNLTASGDEDVLISVLNTDPDNYYSGYDGFIYPGGSLAAYMFASVTIGTGAPCPTPEITSIDPDHAMPNTNINDAQIDGANFVHGINFEVKLVYGTTEIIGTDIGNTTATSFTADFDLTGAPTEVFDVVVTNDCGAVGTGEDLFTVAACTTPAVTGISPDCLHEDSIIVGMEITGTDFVDGPTLAVKLTDGVNEVVDIDPTWVNGVLLTCDFDLDPLPPGNYDVEVTQGCNPLLSDTLVGGFTVHNDNTGISPYVEVAYDSTFDIRDHPGATEVFIIDDGDTYFTPFFDFDYYGITYNHFSIKSNGAIELDEDGTGTESYVGYSSVEDCGDISPFIIPFGEDLDSDEGNDGRILYEIQGTTPNRTLTVMWDDVASWYSSTGSPGSHTFSATFYEATGDIRFQYEDPNIYNTGSYWGDPPIALCNFEYPLYYNEQDELFCALGDWPTTCLDYKAYEVDLPDATPVPPPACDYDTDYVNVGYDSDYECSGSATLVTLGDDETSAEVPIGFTFNYAGTDYTTAGINSNGVLFLGSWDEDPVSLDCDETYYDPSDCIVANSDDLNPVDGGEIKYETRTVGSDQVFIVEWEDVPSFYQTGSANTYQIILFDDADPDCDRIRIQWSQVYEQVDTLIQYNAGNWDVEVCLYDNGGQPVPGAILIEKQ